MGIEQDDFGTLAMKPESVLGPFYRKLVLLRYFPKFGTPGPKFGTAGPKFGTLGPKNRTVVHD